jgi:voltage-gated potassium channel Kch
LLFLVQILIGSLMITLTVVIHILGIIFLIRLLTSWVPRLRPAQSYLGMVEILVVTVLAMFFLHTLEIWSWAALYLWVGEFVDWQRALYFSTVTFSTLGYGDITLQEKWQLLSSFEAVNGVILFGVSTAFIFAVIQKLYQTATKPEN